MISILTNWFKKYRVHIIAWTILIVWETILVSVITTSGAKLHEYCLHYLVTICCFYVNCLVILPWLVKKVKLAWAVTISLAIFLAIYVLGHAFADATIIKIREALSQPVPFGFSKEYLFRTIHRGLFFFSMSFGVYYLTNFLFAKNESDKLSKEKNKVEKELLTTQNLYLKAQINPHFLFNTLHFINSQLPEESNASEAVLRLSKIMHFAFKKEDSSDKIRILEELMQIQELIALQELRGDINKLELQYDLAVCNLKLIPLVLLTLAENIYKHGDLKEEPAVLSLKLENDELRVSSKNKIQVFEGQSNQTGLENLKSRLIASYGKQTKFESLREQNYFKINIAIPIIALAS